jgi:hypothetical protein
MDATMKGPDAVFSMLRFYLEKINVTDSDKVLFVADGARWIWNRVGNLFASLGLSPDRCYELLDFYHAAEQLNKVAGLRKKDRRSAAARLRARYEELSTCASRELSCFG